jgi:hypothetical protein
MALFWVTAGSYPQTNIHDRFSLPMMDMDLLSHLQEPRTTRREPAHQEESTLQPDVRGPLGTIPELFYDYLPRDQMSGGGSTLAEHKTGMVVSEVNATT